jgi:hypothetical protein
MANFTEQYTTAPTYGSLMEMLKIYLNRKDQDTIDAMPFFINSAEKALLRTLRIPPLETILSFNTSEYPEGIIELPSDYLEMKFMWQAGEKPGTLQRITFDQLLRGSAGIYSGGTAAAKNYDQEGINGTGAVDSYAQENGDYNAGYWAINSKYLYVKGASEASPVFMNYYADSPELRGDTETSTLMTLLPDGLLYMAVAEGWKFLMEPEKAVMWEQFGVSRAQQIQAQADDAEFSGSPLTISPI